MICGRKNPFTKTRVKVDESDSESELDEYCLTLHSVDENEVNAKKLFASINVGNTPVKFQLDSGATCNLISAKFLRTEVALFPTRKLLTIYKNTIMKALGTCAVAVSFRKNSKTYHLSRIFCCGR